MSNNVILLLGATGYIGRHVERCLKSRGYNLICPARVQTASPESQEKNVVRPILDLSNPSSLNEILKLCTSLSAVISCVGTRTGGINDSWDVEYGVNLNLLNFAKQVQANHFILLSAICVQKPILEFQYAKLAFERKLIKSGLQYSIVRPTAFFKSLAGQVKRVVSGKKFIFFDNGDKTACKPISERDLATYICDCLNNPDRQGKILPIGGSGVSITPKVQGQILSKVAKKPYRFQSIPSSIFPVFGVTIKPLTLVSNRFKDLKEFIRIGHYYATESMLSWDPISNKYDPEATPEYGEDSLEEFYERFIFNGMKGQDLGSHKFFN